MSKNISPDRPNPNPQLTKSHADLIVEEMPEPPGTFREDDLDGWARDIFQSLYRSDLTDQTGQEIVSSGDYTHYANIYRVKSAVYEDAKSLVETRNSPLPCGHSGIVNQGDTVRCGYRGCDEKFDRDSL